MMDVMELELVEEVLKRRSKFRFRALGSSMSPIIRSGDLVTIVQFEASDLALGDVILFRNNGKFFLHRIIKKYFINNSTKFITKGDFLTTSDPCIESEQILGKLITLERGNRVINFNTIWMVKLGTLIVSIQSIQYPFLIVFLEILKLKFKIKQKLYKQE